MELSPAFLNTGFTHPKTSWLTSDQLQTAWRCSRCLRCLQGPGSHSGSYCTWLLKWHKREVEEGQITWKTSKYVHAFSTEVVLVPPFLKDVCISLMEIGLLDALTKDIVNWAQQNDLTKARSELVQSFMLPD